MRKIFHYTIVTIKYASTFLLFLVCMPALVIGLDQVFKESVIFSYIFWASLFFIVVIYGEEIGSRKDAENKESKRWSDIENGIEQNYEKPSLKEREKIIKRLKEYIEEGKNKKD